ncbi:glycosyltransferase family 4 protein [Thermosipho globiformans]|uniref:glycosyltransferase family 4 protein n=1 Tax=Thermosipho globiformans TaxID=380685 RepID=UPI000F8E184D|nr:glycosyltransferase family 4 protein [Thermosipho globiformans]
MKVLLITNLYPLEKKLYSGIFITKRIQFYKSFDIDFLLFSTKLKHSWTLRFLKKMLNKDYGKIIRNLGITYNQVSETNGILDKIIYKLFSKNDEIKKYLRGLKKEINVEEFNIIHAHGMFGSIPAGYIAKMLNDEYHIPYVVTLHGSDVNYEMAKRQKKELYKNILEQASKAIFVSKALLDKAKSYGYSGKNAVVIPNGYDSNIFKPMDKNIIRKELGIYKEGYKYVGFVGNLIPVKRADKLPEIFEKISKKYNKVKYIIVGDGFLKDKIEKEISRRNLDCIFTGRLSQKYVAKYMNAMDVMILPSRNEGWPCVVPEAQACGTCVLGSSNGGILEAIGFKEYVVEEGNNFEERFADKVVNVLEIGYEKSKFIERAKNYTWENIVRKEVDIYYEILRK